jgi:hypothetical protein
VGFAQLRSVRPPLIEAPCGLVVAAALLSIPALFLLQSVSFPWKAAPQVSFTLWFPGPRAYCWWCLFPVASISFGLDFGFASWSVLVWKQQQPPVLILLYFLGSVSRCSQPHRWFCSDSWVFSAV